MKKPISWLLAVALIFLSGVVVFYFVVGPRLGGVLSGSGLDEWVARQVVRIAGAYIVPEVQFDSFTYTHPGVLEMRGAKLIAPDSGKTEVMRADVLRVTLAEVPSFGKPIVIERIDLERAALRMLRDPASGGFKGLVPFVKADNLKDQNRVDAQVQLSTVLKIKKLTLKDGEVQYNDGTGPETMTLKGVTLDMDVQPDTAQPGWYALKLNIDRSPVFTVVGDVRLNVDTFDAEFSPVKLAATLNEEGLSALPPELQRPLREHDARGAISATLTGSAPLLSPMNARADANIVLDNFNVAAGEYRLPIDRGDIALNIADGRATFGRTEMSLLTGTLSVKDFTVGLSSPDRPLALSWNAQNLELRELLRTKTSPGEAPKLAGKFNSSGSARGSLATLPGSLSGSGSLTVRDGRLMNLPGVTDLMEAMDVFGKAAGVNTLGDSADVKFDLTGEGVSITDGDASTPVAHARFTGLIRYDLTLDILANAGPLEKVQGLFGKVGDLVGKVTDQLVKYRISGPISQPKVEVKPLGL